MSTHPRRSRLSVPVHLRRLPALAAALALAAGALSACGDSTPKHGGGASSSSTAAGGPGMAEAKAAIAPYVGKPGPFGVSETLKRVPRGAHAIFVNCGQPDCQLIYAALAPAAKAMGVNLTQVVAGSTVQGIASAFNSVLQQKPDAVIDPGLDPVLWRPQLQQLAARRIPVVGIELPVDPGNGIVSVIAGPKANEQTGKLQADYVYAQAGQKTNVAFATVPEFRAFQGQADAFKAEMQRLCSSCKVAITNVPAASIGSTAPSQLVSYLQRNQDTNWLVLAFDSMGQGLPQALHAAGVNVQVLGANPGPVTLQYIRDGKQAASFAASQATLAWMAMDATARAIVGQPLGRDEAFGQPPRQFLRKQDVTFDPQAGWLPYPDYQARYKKLWGVG